MNMHLITNLTFAFVLNQNKATKSSCSISAPCSTPGYSTFLGHSAMKTVQGKQKGKEKANIEKLQKTRSRSDFVFCLRLPAFSVCQVAKVNWNVFDRRPVSLLCITTCRQNHRLEVSNVGRITSLLCLFMLLKSIWRARLVRVRRSNKQRSRQCNPRCSR